MKVALGLPAHGGAFRQHEQCLAELRRAEPEWLSIVLPQASNIELSRSVIAAEVLRRGADVLLWIDADVTFTVDAARLVVSEAWRRQAIVGGLYADKQFGGKVRADFRRPGELEPFIVTCGKGGGCVEVNALGFGFLAHPVSVLERIAAHFKMRDLRTGVDRYARDWFSSTEPEWAELMGEDYAFCRRARAAGVRVYAETRPRLGHIGEHVFHLEDGDPALVPKRYETIELEPTWPAAWEEPKT